MFGRRWRPVEGPVDTISIPALSPVVEEVNELHRKQRGLVDRAGELEAWARQLQASLGSYDVLSLFAGVGWSLQLKALGLVDLGVDYDRAVLVARRANGLPSLRLDLWNFRPADFDIMCRAMTGSPSCKKWSIAGNQEATSDLGRILKAIPTVAQGEPLNQVLKGMDPEAALVLSPLEWAVAKRPEWIALEQVRAVQPVWDAVAEALVGLGYSAETGILHAEQYGTPQTRVRSVLVANRTKEVHLPTPTHSKYYPRNPQKLDEGVLPWVSMAQALDFGATRRPGMTVTAGGADTGGPDPFGNAARKGLARERDNGDWEPRTVNTRQLSRKGGGVVAEFERDVDLPSPGLTAQAGKWLLRSNYGTGGNAQDRGTPGASEPAATVTTHSNRNMWVEKDNDVPPARPEVRPSTTIVGSFRPDIVAAPGYRRAGDGPRQNAPDSVRITVQEAAILQGFPEGAQWGDLSNSQRFKLIGNSVPGQMAKAILQAARGVE